MFFILRNNVYRDIVKANAIEYIERLDVNKETEVIVREIKGTRSQQQNRALWGLAYDTILKQGGESMAGWEMQDLHEYFLGEHFGWEVVELFGKTRQRPIKRSSKLSKSEFASFFDFIQRKAAEFGVQIPDPDPNWNLK